MCGKYWIKCNNTKESLERVIEIMKLTLEKIAEFTGGSVRGNKEITVRSASIDSRKLEPDCLFIALKGERTDVVLI